LISESDLQEPCSPQALRAYVLELKERVRRNPQQFERALLKLGLYKEFLDELVPLSCFAILAYPNDHSLRLVLGNQPYDAVVCDALGREVDRVELTVPQNGRAEAEDRALVVDRGFGVVRTGVPGDDLKALGPFLIETCKAKALKDYRGCTLLIAIEPLAPFKGLEAAYDEILGQLADGIRSIRFLAKRVYLLLLPDRLVTIHG
jgi:hypothetical protein